MRLPDLFKLLAEFNVCAADGDGLLELSDMSLTEDMRGPGRNLMYGPFPREKSRSPEITAKTRHDLRQRWYQGGNTQFPKWLAKFWRSNLDEANLEAHLAACWKHRGIDTVVAEILQANGYEVKRAGVPLLITSLLRDGLSHASQKGNSDQIDDKDWDISILVARHDEIARLSEPQIRLNELGIQDIKVIGDWLYLGTTRVPLPPAPEVSKAPQRIERNYLRQLLLAIGSACDLNVELIRSRHTQFRNVENVKAQVEQEYSEYAEDISEARESYFHADHLRLVLRDSAVDGDAEFEKIKDDSYKAIRPTWRRQYSNGLERMYACLEKAIDAPLQKSHITAVSGLFTITHRQGVIHMLVNDNKIEWVSTDES